MADNYERLIKVLGENLKLTGTEIVEILWLATKINVSDFKAFDSVKEKDNNKNKIPDLPPIDRRKQPDKNPPQKKSDRDVGITSKFKKSNDKSLEIEAPDASSLSDHLGIVKSLRPLRKYVASGRATVLDEEATIEKIAELEGIFFPVLKPPLELQFDLALVVDMSNSMIFWQKTTQEFKQLLKRYGIFRNFQSWGLLTDKQGNICLRKGFNSRQKRPKLYSPQRLIDPSGRRLILVVSDCISPIWRNGLAFFQLTVWGKHNVLAIAQILPESMWSRTALSLGTMAQLDCAQPHAPNRNLKIKQLFVWNHDNLSDALKVPVFSLDPELIQTWSEMVVKQGGIGAEGFVFSDFSQLKSSSLPTAEASSNLSSEDRIYNFEMSSSLKAIKLAKLLAASPVINLPFVRLLQKNYDFEQHHVAEVFLGNILKPLTTITPDINADEIQYRFHDEAIRQHFIDSSSRRNSQEIIIRISRYFAERLGTSLKGFYALLQNKAELEQKKQEKQIENFDVDYFARVTTEVLKRLGGAYARLASEIESGLPSEPVPNSSKKPPKQTIENNNQGQVNCIAFSPDGELIASAGHDGSICLWNLEGELINTFEGHQDKVWSIAFSVDGKLIVSGSEDRSVKVWQINNGAILKNWEIETNIYSVAFDRFMQLIAFGGGSTIVQAVEVTTEEFIGNFRITLPGHENLVNCVTFSPNGQLLASCSDDRTIKIWSHRTGELIRTLEGHENFVNAIAFSPEGKQLISASSDLTLKLWDLEGNLINVFEGHKYSVSSVAFHPSGNMIASGSRDGTVRIWNLQGDCLEVLSNEKQTNVRTVAFNPQGTILACGGEAQPIYLYSQESLKPSSPTPSRTTVEIKATDTFKFDIVTIVPKEQISNRPKPEDIYFQEDRFSPTYADNIRYQNYQELSDNEQEGRDYLISSRQGISNVAIFAIHGGKIQVGSTEIANAIAGDNYSFYSFEGIKEGNENDVLYIPSHKFNEPRALEIISEANQVIIIHGFFESNEIVYLGGLDNDLKEEIKLSLQKTGFTKIDDTHKYFKGTNRNNICNRGKTGKGVQIGISWGLRKKLFDSLESKDSNEPILWDRFVQAIRDVLSPLEEAGWRYQTTQGEADYYTEELEEGVRIDMVYIPDGEFMMGSAEGEGNYRVKPQHKVTVQPFFIGKFQITQAQWRAIASRQDLRVERNLDIDPSNFKGNDLPVEKVSWYDAKEFCDRLSQLTGKEYRLPTEAEWEYACRADTTTPFHFGETITTDLANYNGNYTDAGSVKGKYVRGEYREETTPVGYFKVANNFGLYDMHGNVYEWCKDDWHDNYQYTPTDGTAWLSGDSSSKVVRGGYRLSHPEHCRSAYRPYRERDSRHFDVGVRVVCVALRAT